MSPLSTTATHEEAVRAAFPTLLRLDQTVKGGCPRDLYGGWDEDVQDVDILVPKDDDDPYFAKRQLKVCEALAPMGLRFRGIMAKGENCLDLFFSWRQDLLDSVEPCDMEGSRDYLHVQLAREGGFANNQADFSACQLAVR